MHPDFSHAYKQYSLSIVIQVLDAIIVLGRSIRSTARSAGVSRRSVRRWLRGLTERSTGAKGLCFFGSATVCIDGFGNKLIEHFRCTGNGSLASGAAEGMLRLAADFSCNLY